ncbi:cytochrome c biogenesis protein ResB [Modestobacter sp. VKM Ac-2978]|uniref:cytochrome c biogenesis protein ResB n=1 Tax=Modestobacter sp. VKM Ac-2978 TaxID=3004132 RepID=UPI0022AA75D4|nr:cytochrome c biogenesis protein ResB [Modestobacter sp. VKM Ac-2978]MCZ2848285.1 cytochrome c biogenesis protein ResB [Modestobacter sp. VKM Ac-2978]
MTATAPPRPAAPASPPSPPSPGRRVAGRLLRWWRQLTAMRTALILLFLLAVAAIPGSLLPQRSLSQSDVAGYLAEYPTLGPWLDRLYLFDVFSSPWFAAIYLLLFISLIGCVVPRAIEHGRSLFTPPPTAPRHLQRLPESAALTTSLAGPAALDVVEEELRVRRFRVVRREGRSGPEVSAEKGYLRETGNVLFHLSLLALLLGLAGGKLWGYEGSILVTEGQGFCNAFQQYDTHRSGPLVDGEDLSRLCVDLDDFQAEYEENLTAASYTADISWELDGADPVGTTIGVNDPLRVGGDRVYVTGHGFSPVFSITRPDGQTFTDLSAPFLPADLGTMLSQGVLKVPDLGAGSTEQLAIEGFLAPTGVLQAGVLTSIDPQPLDPQVGIDVYTGYLGLDSGLPQSVYALDREQIDRGLLNRVARTNLAIGESTTLPDGTVVTFSGLKEFAALQVSHDPGQVWVLGASIAVLVGLLGMLLVRRERVFARSGPAPDGGGTVLSIGSLTRGSADTGPRFTSLTEDVQAALAARADAPASTPAARGHGPAPDEEAPPS